MRKFLVLCVVLILTLISPIYAFADDPEESNSSGDRLASQEELEQLDIELHQTADLVYSSLSDNGTRATEYTTTDIYNWLNGYFGTSFNSHGSTYPALAYARLEQIRQLLTTINTSANGIAVNTTEIKQNLSSLLDAINPDYDTIGISIYDLLHSCVTALTTIDPNDGDLTLVETLVYMYNELEDMNTTLSSILNSSYSIDNKLTTIYTYLVNFRSDMNTGFSNVNTGITNVNANLATIISRLQAMQNDYNNIVWSTSSSNISLYNSNNNSEIVSAGQFNEVNFSYNLANSRYLSYIYKFDLPIILYSPSRFDKNIDITIKLGSTIINSYSYSINIDSFGKLVLYISDLSLNNINYSSFINIDLKFNNPNYAYITTPFTVSSFYLSSDNIDFYTSYQWLHNRNVNNIFKKFELLYASDDLIDAKADQQDYEDQAIQDFTGSGSAAASGQDLGDMKSISGAIKSGLQTGGSVNNALAPFNTNSGFWGWFSQSNYDNINNIPSSGTRSVNSSQPDIIDFYTNNQYTLQGLLSGGGN